MTTIGAIVAALALLAGFVVGWVGSAMYFENLRCKRNTEAWLAGARAAAPGRPRTRTEPPLPHEGDFEAPPKPRRPR